MSIPEPVRRLFGPSVRPFGGGHSGETFLADVDGADVVLRIYARSPERAAVDVGLLRRLRGVVPVPAVLDARVEPTGELPPYLMTSLLPGQPLDQVLAETGEQTAYELGRAVAGVLLRLATVRFDRSGMLSGSDLAVVPMAEDLRTLEAWVRLQLDRPWFAAWSADDRRALLGLARAVRPVIDAVGGEATLVHSDLNPKNLLVDPDRSEVTGLVDWEFAYVGSRLADLGNLLRFPDGDDPVDSAFLAGAVELAEAGGLPPGWLDTARALDLFAVVELAGRERSNPVVDRARDLLRSTLQTGDLHDGRPRPHREREAR